MTHTPESTPPASQSEALVDDLRLIAVWHTPGAKTPAQPMPDVAKVCQMAANALSVSRNCDGISDASQSEASILHIGTMKVWRGHNPGTIFIQQDNGEGGEFPEADLEAIWQSYYAENF